MKRLSTVVWASLMLFAVSGIAQAAKVSPETVPGATTIDAAKAKQLFEQGVLFVDVRSDKDWSAGRIPDAEHLELKKVFKQDSLGKLVKKDEPVVFYCNGASCMRSSKASALVVGWGYTKVYYYRLGFPDWKAAGYPVE